ncbi:ABC transporter permease [uncultured Fretibacterium sp.]|uniref:ABC transporter permease n=1 Tax=uncultured Fretibacterium sp. TaxID=1678694 RepID=UPI0028DD2D14|nr:ABC transporter permease [uncultured Fretibacterium sp.]
MFAQRLRALTKKEALQIVRDPSSIVIAFILPLTLLFLFGYGLSLDARGIRLGIALEDGGQPARDLARRFAGNPYFKPGLAASRQELLPGLITGELKSVLIVPQGTSAALYSGQNSGRKAALQLLTDGSYPNSGALAENYTVAAILQWGGELSRTSLPIAVEPHFRYNDGLESRYSLIPGIMAVIMALIGTMLTALVVAREWERGTMEALFSTPVSALELLLGKLIPYYLLAIFSTFFSLALAVSLFGVPFRGSLPALFAVASLFMMSALGQGLIISTLSKNQYVASFAALLSAFLPVVLLSGFIFELNSMPFVQRAIAAVLPARYLVTCLQTLFLAGDVWPLLIPNMIKLGLLGLFFLAMTLRYTKKVLA